MIIIDIVVIAGTCILALGVGYLYLKAVIGFLVKEKSLPSPDSYKFLVLIPAHNESTGLTATLDSLAQVESSGRFRIVVIADNCDDDTAGVARKAGVEVVERDEPLLRGKGYALEWALGKYALEDFDAVAFVDADTVVEKNFARTMAAFLSGGADAVQLNYITYARDRKPLSSLQYIANLTENYLFYKPRQILRLPVLLRGTGMAIKTDILKKYPWNSHSVTEDVDYAINLLRAGYRIDFTTFSSVYARSAESFEQTHTQKKRWASGTFALIADKFWPLIISGISSGRPKLIELAFSLFLLSRPLLIYGAFILILLSLISFNPSTFAAINIGYIVLLILYLLSGVFFSDDRKGLLAAILYIPIYGIWYMAVQFKALIGFRKSTWERTGRRTDGD